MSNEMTLFGNQSASALALLQGLEDNLTDKIAGSGGNRRISLENNVFSEVIGGKTVRVSEERAMQVVIINAAAVSRTFYAGTYVKGQKSKPTCWSSDTQRPDESVPADQRQAAACKDCKQNIKGSAAQGEGRACRFAQRVAVVLAGDNGVEDKVYQVNLPATSVFGDADGQKMPLQAYGRYLKAHNTHVISVVTEMRFDPLAIDQRGPDAQQLAGVVQALESTGVGRAAQSHPRKEPAKAIGSRFAGGAQDHAHPDLVTFIEIGC